MISQLPGRLAFASGQLQQLQGQLAESETAVAEATARIDLQPAIKALLEALQARVMSRSVGSLQALLTAILQDVFPEKGDVVLSVSSQRGVPSLNVYLDNEGQLEDAVAGSGGAVDNVLSAGLRYSALMRTRNRRLMVLDEPDCWMRPDRVPSFIAVLRQVSEEVGVQTLLVSHHDESFFADSASLVRLVRADGVPRAEPLPAKKAWESDNQPGLRYIRLVNFKAHADTLIPLFPGMNALVGENDLGKSTAFCSALRAVAYGESDDTCIRHGADEARIELGLEGGRRVEWVRVRNGVPKVTYRVFQGDTLLHEGRQETRGAAPDWIADTLGIREVDGLDIQLRSQKTPVFLLDDTPSRRAQVLSVGSEASRLAELMERYRDLVRKDKDTLVAQGKRVARLRDAVAAATPALDAATRAAEACAASQREAAETDVRLDRIRRAAARIRAHAAAAGALVPETVAMPQVPDASSIRAQALRIRQLLASAAVCLPDALVSPPPAPDVSRIVSISSRLRALQTAAKASVPATLAVPENRAPALAAKLRKFIADLGAADSDLGAARADLDEASAALEALKARLKVCPTCGKEFDHAH